MLGNTPQGGETWGPDAELESAAGPAPPQKPGRLWDPLWAETGECGTEKGGEETDQQDGEGEGSGGGQARGTPQCPGQGGGGTSCLAAMETPCPSPVPRQRAVPMWDGTREMEARP